MASPIWFGPDDNDNSFFTVAGSNSYGTSNYNNALTFDKFKSANPGSGWAEYGKYLNQLGFLEGDYSPEFFKSLGTQLGSIPLVEQQKFQNAINNNLYSHFAESDDMRNAYSDATKKLYGIDTDSSKGKNSQSTTDSTGQWLNYLGGGVKIGTNISNTVLGYKNYDQNKKLINKQIEAVDEQIAASKEYRQQRKDEIDRLNRVRSNTTKAFNTGSVITRSY